jgi:hypothetical protein
LPSVQFLEVPNIVMDDNSVNYLLMLRGSGVAQIAKSARGRGVLLRTGWFGNLRYATAGTAFS